MFGKGQVGASPKHSKVCYTKIDIISPRPFFRNLLEPINPAGRGCIVIHSTMIVPTLECGTHMIIMDNNIIILKLKRLPPVAQKNTLIRLP